MDDKEINEGIEIIKEEKKDNESLNVKVIKKMNKYYENLFRELTEKNDPEDKEKIEAIKKELDKNKEILNKINIPKKERELIKQKKTEESVENKIVLPEIKAEKKEEDKITVILDCERGEYLFKKSDSVELKSYEIRTKLLDSRSVRKQYLEDLYGKYGDFENSEVDITLCKALEEYYTKGESEEIIRKYIEAVNQKDREKLPIEIVYNFNGMKDLRREGFLTRSSANKLMIVADFCEENNLANVQKEETGIKRMINSVKRFFSKREFHGNINLLPEGEKARKIKIEFKNGVYSLEVRKNKRKEIW